MRLPDDAAVGRVQGWLLQAPYEARRAQHGSRRLVKLANSGVVKPNQPILFSVDPFIVFQDLVNLDTNFANSRMDWIFTATPVPGPYALAPSRGRARGLGVGAPSQSVEQARLPSDRREG